MNNTILYKKNKRKKEASSFVLNSVFLHSYNFSFSSFGQRTISIVSVNVQFYYLISWLIADNPYVICVSDQWLNYATRRSQQFLHMMPLLSMHLICAARTLEAFHTEKEWRRQRNGTQEIIFTIWHGHLVSFYHLRCVRCTHFMHYKRSNAKLWNKELHHNSLLCLHLFIVCVGFDSLGVSSSSFSSLLLVSTRKKKRIRHIIAFQPVGSSSLMTTVFVNSLRCPFAVLIFIYNVFKMREHHTRFTLFAHLHARQFISLSNPKWMMMMILLVNGFNLLTNFNERAHTRKKKQESDAQEPLKQIVQQKCVECVCMGFFVFFINNKKKIRTHFAHCAYFAVSLLWWLNTMCFCSLLQYGPIRLHCNALAELFAI